jgi:hypothetical protein
MRCPSCAQPMSAARSERFEYLRCRCGVIVPVAFLEVED